MSSDAGNYTGPELGALRVRGADASSFLQGQLSNDMGLLESARLRFAGLHNPQGRVVALLRLAALEPGDIIAILPAELVDATAAALRRYVLRAKVKIDVTSDHPLMERLLAASAPASATDATAGPAAAHARDIAAGLPQVYAATSGQFVAQMLNLDCIGAISFQKGCYTGQEVIARAHYRGKVKRRMQRFASGSPLHLAPGSALQLADGRNAQLIDSATLPDGSCEFLAVAPLPGAAANLEAEAPAAPATLPPAAGAHAVADSRPLALPYDLPA